MISFIVYNKKGKILRTGHCSEKDFLRQAHSKEFVISGKASDVKQKVINGKIVNKTSEEIESEKPPEIPEIPFGKQPAYITNEQWQSVLNRIATLENA